MGTRWGGIRREETYRRQYGHQASSWGSPQKILPSVPQVSGPSPLGQPRPSAGVPLPPGGPARCVRVPGVPGIPTRNMGQLLGVRAVRRCLRREPQPSLALCQQPSRPRRRQTRPNTAPPPTALKGKTAQFRREESHVVEIPNKFPAKSCLFLVSHPLSHAAQAFSPASVVSPEVLRRAGLGALRQQGNRPFLALLRGFINSPSTVIGRPPKSSPMVIDDPFLSHGQKRLHLIHFNYFPEMIHFP